MRRQWRRFSFHLMRLPVRRRIQYGTGLFWFIFFAYFFFTASGLKRPMMATEGFLEVVKEQRTGVPEGPKEMEAVIFTQRCNTHTNQDR